MPAVRGDLGRALPASEADPIAELRPYEVVREELGARIDELTKPIARLTFSVSEPVGINEKLKRGRGRRLYVSAEAQRFAARVKIAGLMARSSCPEWPRNPYAAAAVTLTIQIYDTAHDAEACEKPVADKLQGILYANDRIVSYGPKAPPIQDGRGRRVEVVAELRAVHDDKMTRKREADADRRRLAGPRRPKRKPAMRKAKWL